MRRVFVNILVVYAYPNKNGFNYAIKNAVLKGIDVSHTVKVIDLYKEEFNPVLYFDKEVKRRNLYLDTETEKYRNLIKQADFIIFIFPIWWNSMPAILKGFIDRVFAKDFAYKYKGIMPVGLLKGKNAWIINTHDSPNLYARFIQKDYGKILNKQILKMCGIRTKRHDSLAFVRRTNELKRENFLKKITLLSSKI